jgi:Tfp pilus assembly protein PilN
MIDQSEKHVNLIPQAWITQRHQKRCIRQWVFAMVATTVLVGLPGLYIGGNAAFTDSGMSENISQANIEFEQHQQAIPLLRERLRILHSEKEVLELVENRIDWREVFGVLVDAANDEVRFTRIIANGGGVDGRENGENTPIEVVLEGLAETQTTARAFLVNIEDTGLFDDVELVETMREEINDFELIRFRIQISVNGEVDVEAQSNEE